MTRNAQAIVNSICIRVFSVTSFTKELEDEIMAMGFTKAEKEEAIVRLKEVFGEKK